MEGVNLITLEQMDFFSFLTRIVTIFTAFTEWFAVPNTSV
jgi:hypothetical protein